MDILATFSQLQTRDVILNTAIIATVIKVAWTALTWGINWLRFASISRETIASIPLAPYKPDYEGVADFFCLVIRYGTDDYIRFMASDREKHDGRLQNAVIPLKKGKNSDGDYVFELKLPVHKRIGTQFKCYADAKSAEKADVLEAMLKQCEFVSDVDRSASPNQYRYYFLIKDRFAQVDTVDGIKNNFCFPQ